MLVAAMNPCPCGFYGTQGKACSCSPQAISKYLGRVSGPMLDRIDIQVEVQPVEYEQLSTRQSAESSATIRERVKRACEIQQRRYHGTGITCNARLTPAILREICVMEPAAEKLLQSAFDRLGLSARGYDRILKVSRTIADLDGSERIASGHISQAVRFRSLDRKYWAG
jgi:magnesium chelatase family protein